LSRKERLKRKEASPVFEHAISTDKQFNNHVESEVKEKQKIKKLIKKSLPYLNTPSLQTEKKKNENIAKE